MSEPGLHKGRLAARAFFIGWLVTLQGCLWFGGWLGLLITFAGKQRRRAWFAQNMLSLFRRLGATFIKIGQIMSTRPDLLPRHVTDALQEL